MQSERVSRPDLFTQMGFGLSYEGILSVGRAGRVVPRSTRGADANVPCHAQSPLS